MTLKCSAEPKCRDVAQIAVFTEEAEPLWRKDRMHPKGQEADFGIVQRRDTLKSRYLTAAFPYALRGASHGIASRDFVCYKRPNHSRNRLTLWGEAPYPPKGEMCMGKDIRIAVRVTAKEKEISFTPATRARPILQGGY